MKFQKKRGAFTLIELMIVIAIIGILASMGTAYYQRAKEQALIKACKKNMFTLEGAITQYSLNAGTEKYPSTIDKAFVDLLLKDGYIKDPIECPWKGVYKVESKQEGGVRDITVRCSIHNTRHDP
ncbi:MAG TPA: type II secretion system protein [Candidatus Wallbacteria bacterium]|nr:type II secretion system protein [Candidatus Wallbacteria bacterium]